MHPFKWFDMFINLQLVCFERFSIHSVTLRLNRNWFNPLFLLKSYRPSQIVPSYRLTCFRTRMKPSSSRDSCKKQRIKPGFYFIFRYFKDVLSLNYSRLSEHLDFKYCIGLESKETTDSKKSAS